MAQHFAGVEPQGYSFGKPYNELVWNMFDHLDCVRLFDRVGEPSPYVFGRDPHDGTTEDDLYGLLGLERDAAEVDIRKSYRRLSLKFHPDKNPCADATGRFRWICNAYHILTDAEARAFWHRRMDRMQRRRGSRQASARAVATSILAAVEQDEDDAEPIPRRMPHRRTRVPQRRG